MSLIRCKLFNVPLNSNGWIAIREGGRVQKYVRGTSGPRDIPLDARTIVLQESGAQVVICVPFNLESVEYLETHVARFLLGPEAMKRMSQSEIVGGKCILEGVRLKSYDKSADNRELLLVFEESTSTCVIAITRGGDVSVSYK